MGSRRWAPTVRYSPTLPNRPVRNQRPRGMDDADWHEAASADTGTSHVRLDSVSIVACEWCDRIFVGETPAAAMSMFREHEAERSASAFRPPSPEIVEANLERARQAVRRVLGEDLERGMER